MAEKLKKTLATEITNGGTVVSSKESIAWTNTYNTRTADLHISPEPMLVNSHQPYQQYGHHKQQHGDYEQQPIYGFIEDKSSWQGPLTKHRQSHVTT